MREKTHLISSLQTHRAVHNLARLLWPLVRGDSDTAWYRAGRLPVVVSAHYEFCPVSEGTSGKLTHPPVFGTDKSVSQKRGPGAPDIEMPWAAH